MGVIHKRLVGNDCLRGLDAAACIFYQSIEQMPKNTSGMVG